MNVSSGRGADDYVLFLDAGSENSEEDKQFEATCSALANRNARQILREIFSRPSTVAEISTRTRLSIQCVSQHITRLENLRIVEGDGLVYQHLRGRSGRRFRISRFAVILMPLNLSKSGKIYDFIDRKLQEKLRSKMPLMFAFAASLGWILSLFGIEDYMNLQASSASFKNSFYGEISKMVNVQQIHQSNSNFLDPMLVLVGSSVSIFVCVYLAIRKKVGERRKRIQPIGSGSDKSIS